MRTETVTVTVTTLDDAEEAKAYLLAVGTKRPSLHPDLNSDDRLKRWNGLNYTQAVGTDADGRQVTITAYHYASGWDDFSTAVEGDPPWGSSLAFTNLVFPIRVFPARAIVRHPEHTPA